LAEVSDDISAGEFQQFGRERCSGVETGNPFAFLQGTTLEGLTEQGGLL
jgi:hypothetical protein